MIELLFLCLLFIKHHIADFEYQPPFQWQNKGTYGHIGGIIHSGQHVIATAIVICFMSLFNSFPLVSIPLLALILVGEFIIHYHTDWAKMYFGEKTNINQDLPRFFRWLGRDQLVHNLTYLAIYYSVFFIGNSG